MEIFPVYTSRDSVRARRATPRLGIGFSQAMPDGWMRMVPFGGGLKGWPKLPETDAMSATVANALKEPMTLPGD